MTKGIVEGSVVERSPRWRSILMFVNLMLASCGVSSTVVTSAGPDGAYELRCQTSLPRCLERVDAVCGGSRYEVLHATDDRAYRGPLDSFETETRSSSASIRCLARGQSLLQGSDHQATATVTAVEPQSPGASPAAMTTK
jgi:hypothetical protein